MLVKKDVLLVCVLQKNQPRCLWLCFVLHVLQLQIAKICINFMSESALLLLYEFYICDYKPYLV